MKRLLILLTAILFCTGGSACLFAQGVVAPTPARVSTARSALDPSVRIKDITFVDGDRNNHVSGGGLVFGLSGTGGQSEQTRSMASNYFLRKGIRVNQAETSNMSAVLVSGKIPPYGRKGETILVNVSVADDATSLRGGTLHQTVLRGIDDEIYAIAQGPIVGGGVAAGGGRCLGHKKSPDRRSLRGDHRARNLRRAIVDQWAIEIGATEQGIFKCDSNHQRDQSGFSKFGSITGFGNGGNSGSAQFPTNVASVISMIGDLRVQPDQHARVVINQKTGTIVMGQQVKISRVLFASENIVISTAESPIASQPAPFSNGETVVLPRTSVDVFESGGTYNVWREGLTVGDLAKALNSLAVSPNSMITFLRRSETKAPCKPNLLLNRNSHDRNWTISQPDWKWHREIRVDEPGGGKQTSDSIESRMASVGKEFEGVFFL